MANSMMSRWWRAAALGGVLALAACGGGSSGGGGGGSSSGGTSSGGTSSGGTSSGGTSSGGTSSGGTSSGGTSSGGSAAISLPTPNATFDYQISGAYTPAAGVAIVDRDRSDSPVAGMYNVCYVNAFQTQPEDAAWWRANHPGLLLQKNGVEVVDGEWNEIVLDVSTVAKRAELLAVVGGWIDECARKGFQAIEPDNLNSWERSQGLLTMADDEAMATLLAARAHADGLAIAQKNTSEMAPDHAKIGFDFAIVEECQPYQRYGDCDAFTEAYGNRWFEIEYPDNGGLQNFQAACAARGGSVSIIYRDRQVVVPTDPDYVYQKC